MNIKATLYYLNNVVFTLPDPWTAADLVVPGVNFKSPIAVKKGRGKDGKPVPLFERVIEKFVPVDDVGYVTYRDKNDFILPFKGMYSWVIEGYIRKKGHDGVFFSTKFTCQQPRDPSGNELLFDCARY